MTAILPNDVIGFWFETLSPEDWYRAPPRDAEVTARFGELYETLRETVPQDWLQTPGGRLAAILVLDQFPRNMFREDAAGLRDGRCCTGAGQGWVIMAGADLALPPEQRAFLEYAVPTHRRP